MITGSVNDCKKESSAPEDVSFVNDKKSDSMQNDRYFPRYMRPRVKLDEKHLNVKKPDDSLGTGSEDDSKKG